MLNLGYGAAMAAGLSESRVADETRFKRQSRESYRARAYRAWKSGLDALYIFNIYNASSPFLRDIGTPEKLAAMDKTWFATIRDGNPAENLAGGNAYCRLPVLTPTNPWLLTVGKPRTLDLFMGDAAAAAGKRAAGARAVCHIRVPGAVAADQVRLTVNDVEIAAGVRTGEWLDFPLAPPSLRAGWNRFGLGLRRPLPKRGDDVWDMEYRCDHKLAYPKQLPWRRAFPSCDYTEEIRDGALFFADNAGGPGDCPALIYPWKVSPDSTVTVEARCQVVESTAPDAVCVRVSNGRAVEMLTLERDRIGLHFAGVRASFPAGKGFHTYRIIMRGKDIQVFADDRLLLDGRGRFTTPSTDRRNWVPLIYGLEDWNRCSLFFGSASSAGTGAAQWEFIRFRTDQTAALVRDFVVTVDYPPYRARAVPATPK